CIDRRSYRFHLRPTTYDLRPTTYDPRPTTYDLRPTTYDLISSLPIVDQPKAAEAAQEAESRAVELMEDLRIRVVDRLVQEFAEQLVELLRGVETLLCPRQELRLGTHAGRDRGGDDRRLLVHFHA